jgi:hypothetical protein
MGRGSDQILSAEEAIHGRLRDKVAPLIGVFDRDPAP